MSWTAVSYWLGVSTRTMRRRRREFGMTENFDNISDEQLDAVIRNIISQTPNAGATLVQGQCSLFYILNFIMIASL